MKKGYKHLVARRKGIITLQDKKKRLPLEKYNIKKGIDFGRMK